MPLSSEEEVRARKRRKRKAAQHWTKFRVDNVQKHHRSEHPKQWGEYLELLQKKDLESEHIKVFFKQTRMEAFFEKRVNVEGRQRVVHIDKNIVDVIVLEILCNVHDEDHQLAGDRALEVFKPVFSVASDGSSTVERYDVSIGAPMEFDYVVSLLACEANICRD